MKLGDATVSLNSLDPDSPDYNDRKLLLNKLIDHLISILSPQLSSALTNQDALLAKSLFYSFNVISKSDYFYSIYFIFINDKINLIWSSFDYSNDWNIEFYSQLFLLLNSQLTWCAQVFPDPKNILARLISFIFSNQHPSLNERLELMYQKHGDSALVFLIQYYRATVSFAIQIEDIITDTTVDWASSIFIEFFTYQKIYNKLEEKYLNSLTSHLLSDTRFDNHHLVRLLVDSIPVFFKTADSSIDHCTSFTLGYGIVGLVEALDVYFSNFILKYSSILSQISSSMFDIFKKKMDNDYSQENFQIGQRVLGTASTISRRLTNFKEKLITYLENSLEQGACKSALETLKQLNDAKFKSLKDGANKTILYQSFQKLSNYTIQSQQFVFDTLFAPIKAILNGISIQESWQTTQKQNISSLNIEIPVFSSSPSSYMTRIGEVLLTLPQTLELYNENESLSFNYSTIPFFNGVEDEDYTRIWLTCLSTGTMTELINVLISIPVLSEIGRKQLITDIEYILNVFVAMDLDVLERMGFLLQLLKIEKNMMGDCQGDVDVLNAVMRMRG